MRRPELWAELMELTPDERIELVHDLWDSIAPEELPPLTADQMDELDRRLAEHQRDPTTAITWEEVKARLQSRFK
jgi:putative addiction module component (TIGR02574 family)